MIFSGGAGVGKRKAVATQHSNRFYYRTIGKWRQGVFLGRFTLK
jgi:hypothetical protein